jgi:arsenate reductase (glutaredoxin)
MTQSPLVIYHNPRCSKSRAACDLLVEKGFKAEVIDYLKTPPDKETLGKLLQKLGMKAEALVRKGEETFKIHYAGKVLNDDDWLNALVTYPILIERPIIVQGDKAVIGRPAEKILELLELD